MDEEQLELSLKEGQSGENKSEDKTPIESTQVKANMSSLKDNQLDNELAENLEDNEKSEQQPNSNSADENSVKLANSKQSRQKFNDLNDEDKRAVVSSWTAQQNLSSFTKDALQFGIREVLLDKGNNIEALTKLSVVLSKTRQTVEDSRNEEDPEVLKKALFEIGKLIEVESRSTSPKFNKLQNVNPQFQSLAQNKMDIGLNLDDFNIRDEYGSHIFNRPQANLGFEYKPFGLNQQQFVPVSKGNKRTDNKINSISGNLKGERDDNKLVKSGAGGNGDSDDDKKQNNNKKNNEGGNKKVNKPQKQKESSESESDDSVMVQPGSLF